MIEWDHDFRVCVPQIHVRHRAGQWQIPGRDFDKTLGDVLFTQNTSPFAVSILAVWRAWN
jgi:hypothetical protein